MADAATRLELHKTEVIDLTSFRPAEKKANILLVDDRPENLIALEAILEPLGENLVKATSGVDALRQLLKHDFAVILLDAQMPVMDGYETASLIREREKSRHVPIMFVSAFNKDRDHVFQGYSVGAVDYIPKPFNPEILKSKVRIFVDLYKKNEQIKEQAALIHRAELRDAERRQVEMAEALEREHMRALTEELEDRVKARTAELMEANKQLEAFCYSVSHDLRAPLRGIIATSKILLEDAGGKLSEDEQRMLQDQEIAAKRLASLIDDLLQFSRLSMKEIERSQVDVTAVSREVAQELLANEKTPPLSIFVEDGIKVDGDPLLVRIVLQNLLENACKYSPEGGDIQVGRRGENGKSELFVKDNGIGFDMAYAHKVFLPFERLVHDHEYPGTGIGLANAHKIVSRHGGRIWAESEPGKGSTFYFTLS